MHIADGIVAPEICLVANGATLGGLFLAGRRLAPEEIVTMAFVGGALFAVPLLHFPLAGVSVHLSLLGLGGILLGKRILPTLFLALLLQALLFQHGGLFSLGLNTLNMATGAFLAAIVWRAGRLAESLRALWAGVAAVLAPALLLGLEFRLSGYGPGMLYLLPPYAAVALLEGFLTVAAVGFIRRVQPEILLDPFRNSAGKRMSI